METKKNSQLFVFLIVLNLLFSQTWALPALQAKAQSNDISKDQGPIKHQSQEIPVPGYSAKMRTKRGIPWAVMGMFLVGESLPRIIPGIVRKVRHVDRVSTSYFSSLLDDHSLKDYPESLTEKQWRIPVHKSHALGVDALSLACTLSQSGTPRGMCACGKQA